ncbi:MAG: restriction endonuclease subunit S [Candidatus Nitrohelix vancouverensis]|uniref:Restriction endonuclease subunit S n=1 Tax=Candidatus Nitrohelix vancouverensis TaxID=2705534 RepID=A0A7T0C1D0_9BACT|nr:MAG: restriction endonuclease subunit S [Candidatus Nitrohelix vancouverensis]
MSEPKTKKLVPKLRFPEFKNAGEWEEKRVSALISTVTPPKKLSTAKYLTEGSYPIIDQSQNYISGWTDDREALITESLPLIIFGDHTCSLKIATEPFAQGADGIKIIKTKNLVDTIYLFQCLQYKPIVMEKYKRHFSTLREKWIQYPSIETGEQQKIADCLSSLDKLISAQNKKIESLKVHKKGLMQQLFPAEGKTLPELRFSEFKNTGEWKEKRLEQLGELVSGLTYSPDDIRDHGLLVLRSSNVKNGEIVLEDNVFVTPDINGANLSKPNDILICVRNGSKALIGKNALIPKGMPRCTHGAFMAIFRAKAANFVFQLFQTEAYTRQVAGDLGATINSINGRQFLKYCFVVPSPEEQKKIADCLSSFDKLISAQSRKVKLLKAHKKGLLQQLFPSVDKVGA